MTSPKPSESAKIYQIKVTLQGSQPPIWRRFLVHGDTTLGKLHWILQVVMGWDNDHMHQFHVGKNLYVDMTMAETSPWQSEDLDESSVTLAGVARRPKAKLIYEYDFGDSWMHELRVEKILPPEPHTHYPVCLAGSGACPLEDSGGIYGYYDKLNAIRDPRHPEHDDVIEWMGANFNPEAFDLGIINMALKKIRR